MRAILPIPTFRGFLILLALLFLWWQPIYHLSDIVASVLVFSFLALLSFLFVLALIQALLLSRRVRAQLLCYSSTENPETKPNSSSQFSARYPLTFHVQTYGGKTFPFFSLTFQTRFDHPQLPFPSLEIAFSEEGTGTAQTVLIFPHRGEWALVQSRFVLSDRFGFFRCRWRIAQFDAPLLRISPYDSFIESSFPILSSMSRPGDLAIDTKNKLGEPFDLKTYHPSDGLRKIVWKMYAKSGELYARHPEPSMNPEGEVVIFVNAKSSDDDLCSDIIRYVERLNEMGLEVLFGCRGGTTIARDIQNARDLLISSTWEADVIEPGVSLKRFLDTLILSSSETHLARVFLVVADTHLHQQSEVAQIASLTRELEHRGIAPIFLIGGEEIVSNASSHSSFLRSWFFGRSLPVRYENFSVKRSFLDWCLQKQWQVFS